MINWRDRLIVLWKAAICCFSHAISTDFRSSFVCIVAPRMNRRSACFMFWNTYSRWPFLMVWETCSRTPSVTPQSLIDRFAFRQNSSSYPVIDCNTVIAVQESLNLTLMEPRAAERPSTSTLRTRRVVSTSSTLFKHEEICCETFPHVTTSAADIDAMEVESTIPTSPRTRPNRQTTTERPAFALKVRDGSPYQLAGRVAAA